MKGVFLIVLAACFLQGMAQQPARLIVRGDDMGYTHSGNEAMIKAYAQGIERSIEVIVPSPWFPEAVKMLQQNPGVDVGVHLTLTSEWDNIKWRPLTICPSITDEDGYFYPMIWPNKSYPGKAVRERNWKLADVEREFRAQIEMALKYIPRVSHISGHMGCTDLSDSVRIMVKGLAREYRIDIDPSAYNVKRFPFDGPAKTFAEKKSAFMKGLKALEPGSTYLFVEHPGLDTPELRAVSHIGYENVASDRQAVTDLWTDKEIIALIKKLGIRLISYRELN